MSSMPSARQTADGILLDLNEPQQRAVRHRDGPLLVVAGPGSGKTRVITRRAAYLVHSGVRPHNILAITFTNKAADEMRRRIEELGVRRGMWIYTFHALGARLLREFGPLAHVEPGFTIYDETDAQRVVKDAIEVCNISEMVVRPDAVRAAISDAKGRLETPADYAERAEWFEHRQIARVYEAYQQLLEQRNAVDFDDLLMRVAIVLRDHPDLAERLNVRFRYVLIDEYQDTNHAQYLIARYLSEHHGNICATGDPDQSIYAWRGADIRNILEFERDFPDATIVRLEQNYRSTQHILGAASSLIKANRKRKRKKLWTQNAPGKPVQVWTFDEGSDEAERIAATIQKLHRARRSYDHFAIFYRINALSRGLEEALRARGIPYKIARGLEFYNRKEIRDVLAYLRVLVNPADEVALLRIINEPPRGIGKTTIARLRTHAHETRRSLLDTVHAAEEVAALGAAKKRVRAFVELLDELHPLREASVAEAVSAVLTQTGLEAALRRERDSGGEDRLANVQELVTAAVRYEADVPEPSLTDFLSRVSLASDQDQVDEHAGVVMLMTLHAAKGLEFPVVFLAGLEQGMLPHERSLGSGTGNIEEERRLCFVGLTRAKEQVYLSHARERVIRGQFLPRSASQFLHELDDGAIQHHNFGSKSAGFGHALLDEGFVPVVDDLPSEEAARLVPKRRLGRRAAHEVVEETSADDPPAPRRLRRRKRSPPSPTADTKPSFKDWKPGTLVQHKHYGVGEIVWIRPAPDQTRADVKFAGHGEKTLILEFSPIRELKRDKLR